MATTYRATVQHENVIKLSDLNRNSSLLFAERRPRLKLREGDDL